MSNIMIGKGVQSLSVGRKLDKYTGVTIKTGQSSDGVEIEYSAGDTTGYVLEINNPIGTAEMAQRILDGLKLRGIRYQPFDAERAIIDPAAELGDGIEIDGVSSVLFRKFTNHSHMMASDVSAPYDEEVNHEFTFVPKTEREFKRESAYARARLTVNENAIAAEVIRAKDSENYLSGRIEVTAAAINAEVTRATAAEGALSGRITVNADAITSEVTRAKNAEGTLGSRIEQRLDNITLSVKSEDGSSTFTLKDGSAEIYTTEKLDLTVKAVNITGKVTVGQIEDRSVVVSSKTETQYYLSTSSETATGGSWSTDIPDWEVNKYIWTRSKTTDTYNGGNEVIRYSPSENGSYDKNVTTARRTARQANTVATAAGQAAAEAQQAAGAAQTSANNAVSVSQTIYKSVAAGTSPGDPPSTFVTDNTGNQNTWTTVRPEYDRNYPALYTATQKQTVGGVVSSTTPALDATTTVIDGANILTDSISANKIAVTDLSAFGATIGGWSLSATTIRKRGDGYDVYLQAPATPQSSYNAISVSWGGESKFYVTYGGYLFSKNAKITGEIIAEKGVIGGVKIENGTLSGIKDANIAVGGISGGSGGSIAGSSLTGWNVASSTLSSAKMDSGVYSSLYQGSLFGQATTQNTNTYPDHFTTGYLRAMSWIWTAGLGIGNYGCDWKYLTIGGKSYWVLTGNPG